MYRIFYIIYKFFAKHLFLLFCIFCLLFFYFLFSIKNIDFIEDIASFMPQNENIQKFNQIYKKIPFLEKVIFKVSCQKSEEIDNVNQIKEYADKFVKELKKPALKKYIKKVEYKISQDQIVNIYDIFYKNLPLFLNEKDYNEITKKITHVEIAENLKANYKRLISPGSFFFKSYILKDPLNFTALALKHLDDLKYDDSYIIYQNYLFTKDKKNLVFFIIPEFSANKTSENALFFKKVDKIIQKITFDSNDKIKIHYFGSAPVSAANATRIKKDIIITVIIAFLIIAVFVNFFIQKKRILFFLFFPVFFGALFALYFLATIKTEVSLIALGIGSVMLGITIDYSIHVCTHFFKEKNIKKAFKDITIPLIMSSFTTTAAFLCLLIVKSEMLVDLGLFAAFSIIGATLFALIGLPHLLKKLNLRDQKNVRRRNIFTNIIGYQYESNKYLLGAVVILAVISIFTYKYAKFEENLDTLNYLSPQLVKSENEFKKILKNSLKSTYILTTADTLDKVLVKNEKLSEHFKKLYDQSVLDRFITINTVLKSEEVQRRKIKHWENFWTKDKIKNLKEIFYLESKKYGFKKKAFNNFLNLINKKYNTLNLRDFQRLKNILLKDLIIESKDNIMVLNILKINNKKGDVVYNKFKNMPDTIIADKKFLVNEYITVLKKDFSKLVDISLVIIFLILFFFLGRIELAIITYLPMLLSWYLTQGIMGLAGIKFNIFNIIISTFIFGLGIDYSIFIIRGLLQKYQKNDDNLDSYKTSILLSAFTTIVGIGVLIFAGHPALKSIALMSIIGIFSVVLVSFVVTPFLFNLLAGKPGKRRPVTIIKILQNMMIYSIFITGCILLTLLELLILLVPFSLKKKQNIINYLISLCCKMIITFGFRLFLTKVTVINKHAEDFKEPAVIIANHQSFLDIIMILQLNYKMIMLIKKWVRKFPLWSIILKRAGYFPVERGIKDNLEFFKDQVKRGISVFVFPEGARSDDNRIKRFHKGAFYLAKELGLDILPVFIYGTGECVKKETLLINSHPIELYIGKRIKSSDKSFGKTYQDSAKKIKEYYKQLEKEITENKKFYIYKKFLYDNYIYKGIFIELDLRWQLFKEKIYYEINKIIPETANIIELGCGYGFLIFMLGLVSRNRTFLGIDLNKNKVDIAKNCALKTDNINFSSDKLGKILLTNFDVLLISDFKSFISEKGNFKNINLSAKYFKKNQLIIIKNEKIEYSVLDRFISLYNLKREKSFGSINSFKYLVFKK